MISLAHAGAVAETRRTSTKIRSPRWFRKRCKVLRCKTQARTDPWRLAHVVVLQGTAYLFQCNWHWSDLPLLAPNPATSSLFACQMMHIFRYCSRQCQESDWKKVECLLQSYPLKKGFLQYLIIFQYSLNLHSVIQFYYQIHKKQHFEAQEVGNKRMKSRFGMTKFDLRILNP